MLQCFRIIKTIDYQADNDNVNKYASVFIAWTETHKHTASSLIGSRTIADTRLSNSTCGMFFIKGVRRKDMLSVVYFSAALYASVCRRFAWTETLHLHLSEVEQSQRPAFRCPRDFQCEEASHIKASQKERRWHRCIQTQSDQHASGAARIPRPTPRTPAQDLSISETPKILSTYYRCCCLSPPSK